MCTRADTLLQQRHTRGGQRPPQESALTFRLVWDSVSHCSLLLKLGKLACSLGTLLPPRCRVPNRALSSGDRSGPHGRMALCPVSSLLRVNSLGHTCSQNAKCSKEGEEAGFFPGVSRTVLALALPPAPRSRSLSARVCTALPAVIVGPKVQERWPRGVCGPELT